MVDYPDHQRGIRLVGTDITLDIRIEASDVDLNMIFTDQSVAVFDAAKWFAHEAEQVFVSGTASENEGTWKEILSYAVPADKVFYAVGVAYSVIAGDGVAYNTHMRLYLAASIVFRMGSVVGDAIPLDTPIRATAAQVLQILMEYWAVGASATMTASLWGYLEDA